MNTPQTPDDWKRLLRASGGPLSDMTVEMLVEFIEAMETRIQWLQLAVAERDSWINGHADRHHRLCTTDLIRLADAHYDPTQYMSIGWSKLTAAINHEFLHGSTKCPEKS